MLLIARPVMAAATSEVTGVVLEQNGSTLALKLETTGQKDSSPKIFTFNQGNNYVADIPNTRLGTDRGFEQKNPMTGIASVEVKQVDEKTIRVLVKGEESPPTGKLISQGPGGIVFNFTGAVSSSSNNRSDTTPEKLTRTEPIAQARETAPALIPDPEIIIEDNRVSVAGDRRQSVASSPNQPFLARAVAPPVGDIAVSNINSSSAIINLGTSARVPRLLLREAPVQEVLGLLARSAGLNLIFTGAEGEEVISNISLDLENESIETVFNSVLRVSGLEANRDGKIIYVGAKLPAAARNVITRTLRLNQVSAASAATFLASQGAAVQQIVTPITEIVDPVTNRVVQRRAEPAQLTPISVNQPEGSKAPLLLQGLTVTTDDRLNSITMVGEPRTIQIASSFLVQLDARRRQVAVNVKVIDVNLSNTDRFKSSFSFGVGDGFFVNDEGAAVFNYGGVNPATTGEAIGSQFSPPVIDFPNSSAVFFDPQDAPFSDVDRAPGIPFARPDFGTDNNPFQPGVSDIGEDGTITFTPPTLFQFPTRLLARLEAQITSGNAKILTDPTLVVQEGQEATVKLVEQVITSIRTDIDVESGVRTVTPVIGEAGLNLTVNIEKIDDNGFINLAVSPVVTAISGTENFSSGGVANQLSLLSIRELSSGLVRLRDDQTLILSGIIQEDDKTTISKLPILGDIPLLGALFRNTERDLQRNEVIVLVTPQVMDDSSHSGFGYNYNPGPEASQMLRQQGIRVPKASE